MKVLDPVVRRGEVRGDPGGAVRAAVLGDDYLEAPHREERGERFYGPLDGVREGVLLVVRGEDDAHLDGPSHWAALGRQRV